MPHGESSQGTQGASATDQVRQAAKERAGAIMQDAKETARSKLGEHKHTVATGLGQVAEALRTSAHELQDKEQATVARLANGAADGLQQLSTRLEGRDLEALVHDAESLARRQPAVFFGAAVAAGFLAMRFMKSSSHPQSGSASH